MDLENYRRTNLYKNIDLTEHLNKYKTFTYQTVEALAIKDNFHSEINILQPPYIYQQNNPANNLGEKYGHQRQAICQLFYTCLKYFL